MNVTTTTMTALLAFPTASTLASPLVIYEDAQGTMMGTMRQTSSLVSRAEVSSSTARTCVTVCSSDDSEDGHNNPHECFQLVSISNTVISSSTGEPLRNTDLKAWNCIGTATWLYTPSRAPRLNVSQVHSMASVCEACLPIQPMSGALTLNAHHRDSLSVLWVSSDASIPQCRQCHASWPDAGIPSSPPTAKSRHDLKTHTHHLIPTCQHLQY